MAKKTRKGASFEREVSKMLSLWWTGGERDDIFWRSSQSGGRATARAKKGKGTAGSYGDITALDPIGKPLTDLVCLELKRGYTKDTDVMALLDSKQKEPMLLKHWNQCERDRQAAGAAHSLVIIKRDHMTTCVYMSLDSYVGLASCFDVDVKIPCISYYSEEVTMFMFKLDDFLKLVNPRKLEEMSCARKQ